MGSLVNLFGSKEQPLIVKSEMAMDADSFRTDIIRPALKVTSLWSHSAENLVLGTFLVESGLRVVKQYGDGPGLGHGQMEPATYFDNVKYLDLRKRDLREQILSACYLQTFPEPSALMWNMRLAVLMARIHYYRRPEPLPDANDVMGMAQFWKSFYNTKLGKGEVQDYIKAWEHHT